MQSLAETAKHLWKRPLRGGKKVGPSQDLQSYALTHINPDFGPKCQDNFQDWKTKGKKNKRPSPEDLKGGVFFFFKEGL